MTGRVLVVGAINVDLVVTARRLPGPGETVVGPGVERHGGGKGANAAVAAARAGAEVRYCGAVGADDMGTAALEELRSEGIDVTDVTVLEGVSTGMALIAVDVKGENQIAVGAGANASVDPAVVRDAVERAVTWAGSILVSSEISPEAVSAAVESASSHGIRCILNPAPVIPEMRDLVDCGPVLTPNTSELRDLYELIFESTEKSTTEMASEVAAHTKSPVVVTLGAEGVLVAAADGVTTPLPTRIGITVRDTTGAGDTFNGVFAASLATGESVLAASTRGMTAATLSVGSVGARPGMPHGRTIDAELNSDAGHIAGR